jgi:hypothetical protein
MACDLAAIAEESYGEESLRAQYLICPETGQLKKQPLYEKSSLTSINKFIKVSITHITQLQFLLHVYCM